ncbi:MAG: hypothetical protein ACR2I2_09830 [Bryobacteraceae bacterium]
MATMINSEDCDPRERDLEQLFRRYREACEPLEPSVNFMPAIWQKIEARQANNWLFGKMARGFVTAALAVSCILALFLALPNSQNSAFENGSYVDVLAADHARESSLYFDSVRLSTVADTEDQGKE